MTGITRKLAAGAVAGLVGTLVMDLVWYGRYRRGGGDAGFVEWDLSSGTESFDEAPAPGQVGKKAADTVGIDLPDERAAETTNVVHWLTGAGYGIGHGLAQDGRSLVTGGLLTGLGAVANSYATLGAMGVYDPVWEYERETLTKDLTAHLAFGLATSAAYRAISSAVGMRGR